MEDEIFVSVSENMYQPLSQIWPEIGEYIIIFNIINQTLSVVILLLY